MRPAHRLILFGGYDPDAQNYFSRVAAAGGSLASATKKAFNDYVRGTKSDGDWDLIIRGSLLLTDGFAGLFVPFKVGGGSASDTNVNFVSGDYSLATGLTGNGTTKYLNTVMLANVLTANDTHIAIYNRSSTNGITLGAIDVSDNRLLVSAPSGNYISDQYKSSGGGRLSVATGATPFGFIIGTRTASNVHTIYRNGTSITSNATTAGSLPAIALTVFAYNNNGTPAVDGSGICGGYTVGKGVSSTAAGRMNARMQALQAALGRNV